MDWIRSARKSVWRDKRRSILHLQTRRDEGQQRRVKVSSGVGATQGDHDPWKPNGKLFQEVFIWKRKIQEECPCLLVTTISSMTEFEPDWFSIKQP